MMMSKSKTKVTLDQEKMSEIFLRCQERTEKYDRENTFMHEDWNELVEAGYMQLPVPVEMGGCGLKMDAVMQWQRRLGYHAAATALAVNMHLYWVGLAADLWRSGDESVAWLLREAAAGKVFAAGHAESGNDLPFIYSTTEAIKVEGGYVFKGRKSFGSLTPVWSYLGIHGQDNSDPDNPKIVHAFLPRDTDGYKIRKTWDNVLGMRATRSDDTLLEDVFVPDHYVVRVLDAGFKGMDNFALGVFAWALTGFGNIYFGQAQRVFDMIVNKLKLKESKALRSKTMNHHPGVQHDIAEMAMTLYGIEPQLDNLAKDWSEGRDYGDLWGIKIIATKCRVAEECWKVVDRSLDLAGGFGIFPKSGLEKMFRDGRLGRLHPANRYLSREFLGKALLGVDLDRAPRWG